MKNKVYRVATRIKGSKELMSLVGDGEGPKTFETWKEANEYAKICREHNHNDSSREPRSFVVLNFDK